MLVLLCGILWRLEAQVSPMLDSGRIEGVDLVGMRLTEVFATFGAPDTVLAVRGVESWQDDVVFVYRDFDLYLYRDRVWQAALRTACGIMPGDSKQVILLSLGEQAESTASSVSYQVSGRPWPLGLRFTLNERGAVSAIYLYRMDF
jgi:hypothetical protein